jgi:uncharacterized protein YndB with AHSA1/START domain
MGNWGYVAVLIAAAVTAPALAAVSDVGAGGFSVAETAHVAAPPGQVYAALIEPGRWWDARHTFSQDAANLKLDARAGGCWCESLPGGGSVQHMTVVNAMPGRLLRLSGALGPMQAMPVAGVMTWTLKPAGDGTDITLAYAIGGYSAGGFTGMSGAVDGVLGEQVGRLKAYVETGRP